ncbi:MAG: diaminopimelate epimerase [Gammaproteobacteria bacterium]|nr:diaminopimelate epimerase [Gammaproteobacteria bacterium]
MNESATFFKMHVCGNDFMVVDATSTRLEFNNEKIRYWSDRRTGIGFDQLLVLGHPTATEHDFTLQIYNSDGSAAEQCGNGCAAVFAMARTLELTSSETVALDTPGGVVGCRLGSMHPLRIAVQMRPPTPHTALAPYQSSNDDYLHSIYLPSPMDRSVEAYVLSLGNPHAVVFVDDVRTCDLESLGIALQSHELFPNSTNVEILQHGDRSIGHLRIFERGVGETLACGSGACAAVVAGRLAGLFDDRVAIHMPGGRVNVEWRGAKEPVVLECQPEFVFKGTLSG